jgi:hypothetical protein
LAKTRVVWKEIIVPQTDISVTQETWWEFTHIGCT